MIRRFGRAAWFAKRTIQGGAARQKAAITATLDALDGEARLFTEEANNRRIATAATLTYFNTRSPEIVWAERRAALAQWYATFAAAIHARDQDRCRKGPLRVAVKAPASKLDTGRLSNYQAGT